MKISKYSKYKRMMVNGRSLVTIMAICLGASAFKTEIIRTCLHMDGIGWKRAVFVSAPCGIVDMVSDRTQSCLS